MCNISPWMRLDGGAVFFQRTFWGLILQVFCVTSFRKYSRHGSITQLLREINEMQIPSHQRVGFLDKVNEVMRSGTSNLDHWGHEGEQRISCLHARALHFPLHRLQKKRERERERERMSSLESCNCVFIPVQRIARVAIFSADLDYKCILRDISF